MRTTFVFDTKIYEISGDYYTRTLIYKLWEDRYIPYFGDINLVTRVEKRSIDFLKENPMLQKVNGNNVTVSPVREYRSIPDAFIKRKKINQFLKKILISSDFVIIRTPAILSNISAKICLDNNIPFLNEVVADPWNGYYYHSNIAGKIVAPYMYWKTKIVCKKSNNILYVTDNYLQDRYPSLGKKQIGISDVIIPENNLDVLKKRIEKISSKNSNQVYKFGIVGNYDLKTKGQDQAIKALPYLSKNCILELVGGGQSNCLEELAIKLGVEDRVKFLGTKKSGNEMFEWMDQLDTIILPSFQEGLPRVLVEGMSRALPAIGSDVGGIPELIDNYFIYKKGKSQELCDLMNIMYEKTDLQLKQAERNYEESKRFLAERLDSRREYFYNSILEGIKIDE